MEKERNYKIIAESVEEFTILEKGYNKLIKNFALTISSGRILVQKGFYFKDEPMKIEISPLQNTDEIKRVSKFNSNPKWNILGSTRDEWNIEGEENLYRIRAKRLDTLL